MRPLNRPMFRYGGPIKEGVMSGIREPKRNGGAALVGNPLFPKDASGRARHGWWIPVGIAGRAVINQGLKKVGQKALNPKNLQGIFNVGYKNVQNAAGKGIPAGATGWKNIGKNWFSGDPTVKGAKWGWKALTSPTANTWAQKGVRMAISPTTIIGGALYYLWPDGTKRKTPPPGGTGGATGQKPWESNVGMKGDGSWFAAQAEKEAKLKAEKVRKEQIQKYKDIMDIKGMNKDAAYNSLIAASQAINESGDFKGDLKSGKLINQIISGASKAFDKPKATKDAINTLILQNELKKDLNKEENALAKLLTQKKIQVADKQLKGDSTAEVIQAIALRTGMPQGDQLNQLVSLNNPELNLKTIPTKDMGQKDPITYIAEIVSSVNNDPKTPNYPAGNYVIKDKVVQITEDGSITPIPINALK